jgi:hypothetical protein
MLRRRRCACVAAGGNPLPKDGYETGAPHGHGDAVVHSSRKAVLARTCHCFGCHGRDGGALFGPSWFRISRAASKPSISGMWQSRRITEWKSNFEAV